MNIFLNFVDFIILTVFFGLIGDWQNKRELEEKQRKEQEKKEMEQKGMVFSGTSPDGNLVEIVEIKEHPYFIAAQFHPEFKSRPNNAGKLFVEFVKACKNM